MKAKINKRLIQIGVGCIILALILTAYLYRNIKRAAMPEATTKVVHFNKSIPKNTILEDRDLELLEVPVSRVPERALNSKESLVGQRLIIDVNRWEYATETKTTSRGDIKVDVEDMWIIGIDVKDISNYMGIQLQSGQYYGLIYDNLTDELDVRHMVKIVSLVDNVGKEIFSNGEGVAKTINVAVETKEEMLEITKFKHLGMIFEIIKTPEDWKLQN